MSQATHAVSLGVQNATSKWLLEHDHDHTKKAELTENQIAFEILSALQLS